jgi:hypothetical protein
MDTTTRASFTIRRYVFRAGAQNARLHETAALTPQEACALATIAAKHEGYEVLSATYIRPPANAVFDKWSWDIELEVRPAYGWNDRVPGCDSCLNQGSFGPSHYPSPRCQSGKYPHCTCGACFD